MQELRIKIAESETANVDIIPVNGGVEVVVKYGSPAAGNTAKKPFKFHEKESEADPEDIIRQMKAAARLEYKKEDSDKKELERFVTFWEKKISKDGWKGNKFNFDVLYERWLENKR